MLDEINEIDFQFELKSIKNEKKINIISAGNFFVYNYLVFFE